MSIVEPTLLLQAQQALFDALCAKSRELREEQGWEQLRNIDVFKPVPKRRCPRDADGDGNCKWCNVFCGGVCPMI